MTTHMTLLPAYTVSVRELKCGGDIGDAKESDADASRVGRDFRLNLLERYDKPCYERVYSASHGPC